MSNEILHTRIQERFNDIFENPPEVPNYIIDNLRHELRPYQEHALRQFIYTQRSDTADISFNHLLFHMTTGSGKTLVLAGTILYLFQEKGHQNFIFFVNSDAIIKKTFDNLTNMGSSKYLFRKDGIVIDGEHITIQVVDVFPAIPADNTIYLKLTTIQKLHMDLTNPRENGLTFESLEDSKVVLLADEAHHINVLTRSDKRKLTTKEEQERTWEYTVSKLLRLNRENRLLEFTATIDLNKDALFHKYSDKIVYQYDLKRFMTDGYSKNVVLLRANEDDDKKMLHAMLLSQYRKYIAKENGIELKPIILFKSNKIAISLNANQIFLSLVENLTVPQLEKVIQNGLAVYQNKMSIWHKMFQYYSNVNLDQVVRDLQWDFTKETTLNANDASFLSESNALLLNTLEDPDNPIRTIFAVAKLNEGWDVLNLFDIVRISEGATSTKTTTDSEAQLIGRGARYYPFVHEGEKSYQRRFDDIASDLKVIETLHYHTINENAYIKNLEKSLESANIQVKEDKYERLEAKIKPKIRKLDFFKNGKIYINKVVPTTADDYQSFENYNVPSTFEVDLESSVEKRFGSKLETYSGTKRHEEQLVISKPILQKAIQRNKFYRFDNLKQYVPSISSMKHFIESPNFLGGVTIILSLPVGISEKDLSPREKLKIVERFLAYAEKNIRNNFMKERGTPIFEGVSFPELIDDYVIEISKVSNSIQVNEVKKPRNMRDHDWYIYDKAIVNGLENDMLDFINNYIDELKERYNDVYLIRNERKVKIVEIDGTRGFMPDFLLYLKDDQCTYQVFLEPKGKNLLEQDKWKQEFLLSLSENPNIEILTENEKVRLLGIKFYTDVSDVNEHTISAHHFQINPAYHLK
ncbi:DEAD/DEAH box helicase family protein [Caldibacillus thermoamylovorans]|uniref:DEAD/DEAH box helicase family protein n=1 Tax=Caldibacillus thermoamylovorans TaxID=35841 RepID=UPI00203F49A0|nr:DEAD/DEAH box helicase family protein [Caldibacillus thermoamylovorans]MCM3799779.1 DEAD/DEAH box helicase family protein [Caldibacillus thermoamylovorans]